MHRIANTTELQVELHKLLELASSARPSRVKLARQIEALSQRVAMDEAGQALLRACRRHAFKTRGAWGMRERVKLCDEPNRVPCAIIDLERTDPKTRCPIVLASGASWQDVYDQLVKAGELKP